MLFRLKDEVVKYVVDSLPDERAVDHEFAINAMQNGFEAVPLSRILGIEEIQEV
jgi:hypothetical protein